MSGVSPLSMSCQKTRTNKQPTNQHKTTSYQTSHQSSDLTLRLHGLQTARFTEQRADSSPRPSTAFILASPVRSTAPPDLHLGPRASYNKKKKERNACHRQRHGDVNDNYPVCDVNMSTFDTAPASCNALWVGSTLLPARAGGSPVVGQSN